MLAFLPATTWAQDITKMPGGHAAGDIALIGKSHPGVASGAERLDGRRRVPGLQLAPMAGTMTSDASLATLSTGRNSVAGLVNVLSYAGGIPINDGGTYTVGNAPVGSPFYGITTLAGLAAIQVDGSTPFSFLTDSGAVIGPLCTPGSATNCFTSPAGAYKLTDAKVPSIDIAWLALQAALLTKRAYIPGILPTSGNVGYEVGTSLPLPLMVPIAPEADANNLVLGDRIHGDGPRASVVFAGSSFGYASDGTTVLPLISCGDPGATAAGATGRWAGNSAQCSGQIDNVGFWGSQPAAQGLSSTYRTDGIAFGARLRATDVTASWFWHDISMVGDHSLYIRLGADEGVYGLYFAPPNPALLGDLQFIDLAVSGQSVAAVDVDGAASMNGYYDGETYLNAGLYAIYGEPNGCSPTVGGAHFKNLMTEFLGLGVVEDGHNWNGSTYTDAAKCRAVVDMDTDHWFTSYSNGNITGGTAGGRRRRATLDASTVSGRLHGLDTNGGNIVPVADNAGAAGIAMINVNGIADAGSGIGLELEGSMLNLFRAGVGAGVGGATVPVLSATAQGGNLAITGAEATWQDPGGEGGTFQLLQTEGNYTRTVPGDVMEYLAGTYGTAAPAGYAAAQPVMGVVEQAGLTSGMIMPLQTRGTALISAGYHWGNDGYEKKSTGIGGRTTFVPGWGGTNGSYTITATGGGCSTEPTYTVTVGGGAITGITSLNTTGPAGCTGTPIVPLSSVPGLTGATVTPQWPAAGETTASGAQDGIIIGYGLHAGTGSTTAGTNTSYSRLLGMQ